jgi:PfaD family protein
MANGISTPEMVVCAARAGLVGFFGAGGLGLAEVEQGLARIGESLGSDADRLPWGSNLIFSPGEPELEEAVADLYLRRGVRRVSASAYMRLTPAVVRYAASGLSLDPSGAIQRRNHLFAKVSREEVARQFLSPPPAGLLEALVGRGQLGREEANLAARLPLAEDITVEADSGGHTDNRPLTVIVPAITGLRDQLQAERGYPRPVRVGVAGGLGTPGAVAAAFATGAAYVLTGTVNQAAVESGLSAAGKALLAQAGVADVTMAPSPDMFELGVKVQVLKRGTLFAARATRLYELFAAHDSLEALPGEERLRLESEVFRAPLDEVWRETRAYFDARQPAEIERAEQEPKHRMALVFRWYLGRSSHWAIAGDPERKLDYQIWCGPAIGAFNAWTAGSFLGQPEARTVDQIARNLLEGAAVVTRAHQLRCYGVPVPAVAYDFRPRPLR